MPLAIVADPGDENANSYATQAEAEAWAQYRVGGAAFMALDADQKIQALVTATEDIDSLEEEPGFLGERAYEDQALAFPRGDDAEIPRRIKKATIELAMSYAPAIAGGTDPLNATVANGNIKEDTVGPITTVYFGPRDVAANSIERFPASVQRWLAGFVVTESTGWGQGTVTRGS